MWAKFYRDVSGHWRWRLYSRNGRIVADSGEGYRRAIDCKRALYRMLEVKKFRVEGYPVRSDRVA